MDDDRTVEIAARLRVRPDVVALVVGAPWWPAELFGGRRADDADRATEWFAAGRPVQLMLGIGSDGGPLLARPEPGWDGPGTPTLDPADVRPVPELAGCDDVTGAAAHRVRRVRDEHDADAPDEIRHCEVSITQAREAAEGGLCHGCLSRWQGVLF